MIKNYIISKNNLFKLIQKLNKSFNIIINLKKLINTRKLF